MVGAGRLEASSRWNPGRLLNITNAQDGPAQQRSPAPNARNAAVEKAQPEGCHAVQHPVTLEIISGSCSSVCILYYSNCGGNGAVGVDGTYLHVWKLNSLRTVSNSSNERKSTHHCLNLFYFILFWKTETLQILDVLLNFFLFNIELLLCEAVIW